MFGADSYRFLRDPNQAARWRELSTFIGANALAFYSVYDALRSSELQEPGGSFRFRGSKWSFSTAAFFLGPFWLFYRKVWLWGFAFTVVWILRLPASVRGCAPSKVAAVIGGIHILAMVGSLVSEFQNRVQRL